MIKIDNTSGRRWARFALVSTLVVSVVANVTHAVLAASEITLWLRVPGAAIWPVLSFLAIEIIVRIAWRSTFAHYLARVFILGPAIPAVIVSYEHQERLLRMMGESLLVQRIGPLAIDGLMIGCTLALLFTREIVGQSEALEIERAPEIEIEREIPPVIEQAERVIEQAGRGERGGTKAIIAARMLQDGEAPAAVAAHVGMSLPGVRKYAAIVRELRDNPNLPIDARRRSVRSDVVDSIRAWARLESVR